MDLWFWLVVAAAIVTIWFIWAKAFSLQTDLELAEDEIAEAHATIDRLTRELQTLPSRGAGGRLTKRAA